MGVVRRPRRPQVPCLLWLLRQICLWGPEPHTPLAPPAPRAPLGAGSRPGPLDRKVGEPVQLSLHLCPAQHGQAAPGATVSSRDPDTENKARTYSSRI